MKHVYVLTVYLFCLSFLFSQSDLLDSETLDGLLGVEADGEGQNLPVSVFEELVNNKSMDIKFDTKLTLGYSPGFSHLPLESLNYEDTPILKLKNTLILDFRSSALRAHQKWTIISPDFEWDLKEIFVDYTPFEGFSLRAGRFTETWGESKNFSHTNLISRIPEDYGSGTDPLAIRSMVPWGTGLVEVIFLSREGFWEDEDSPALDEFGYGLRINPPVSNADLTASFFYHTEMNLRGTLSLKTTLFDSIESYGEVLCSIDRDLLDGTFDEDNATGDGKVDNPVDYSLNLGLYRDFFKGKLSLGGEYFFNGEESELDMADVDWPLFYGHNLAFYTRVKQGKWRFVFYSRYSFYESSGILGPALTWDFSDIAKIQLGGGWAWGDNGYDLYNPDELYRDIFASFQIVINGSLKKTL